MTAPASSTAIGCPNRSLAYPSAQRLNSAVSVASAEGAFACRAPGCSDSACFTWAADPWWPGLGVTPLAAGNIGAGRAAPGNTAHRCHKHIA